MKFFSEISPALLERTKVINENDLRLNEERKNIEQQIELLGKFNPQAPVAQKVADEVVFRRFQGEGVELF